MDKQVVHIYGASGSGTSTMGRFICDKLGFFFMDTDDFYWEAADPPYTAKRTVSDRLALMRKDIAEHDGVVISGSLVDWGDELIPFFTLVVRMETDTAIRIGRLKKGNGSVLETESIRAETCTKPTRSLLIGPRFMTAVV